MVETDIFNLLKTLVPNVFPDVAPNGTPLPYATYQQVGGLVINYSDAATPNKQHGIFQVNIWAATRLEAKALALQVEDAFRASSAFVARPDGAPISQYEPDTQLYGTLQDFSIWADR